MGIKRIKLNGEQVDLSEEGIDTGRYKVYGLGSTSQKVEKIISQNKPQKEPEQEKQLKER